MNQTPRNVLPTAGLLGCFFLLPAVSLAAPKVTDSHQQRERLTRFLPLTNIQQIEVVEGSNCLSTKFRATVADPETLNTRTINIIEVRANEQTLAQPAVIIVPTIEGVTFLESRLSQNFCTDNFVAYVADVHMGAYPDQLPAAGFEDLNNRLSVTSLRSVVSWVQARQWVQPTKLAFVGNSLGAITGSMFASVEDRIKAFIISGGGGDLPLILATSEAKDITTMREKRMKHLKLRTVEQYLGWLRDTISIEPLSVARFVDRDKVYMMRVTNDDQVPTAEQFRLWYALGGPRFEDFNLGHVGSIVTFALVYYDLMADFIRSKI